MAVELAAAGKSRGGRDLLRPWIQSFNLGAIYDAKKIRGQIDEVEKYTDGGWLLWNAANRYTDAGLKLAEEKSIISKSFEEIFEEIKEGAKREIRDAI